MISKESEETHAFHKHFTNTWYHAGSLKDRDWTKGMKNWHHPGGENPHQEMAPEPVARLGYFLTCYKIG